MDLLDPQRVFFSISCHNNLSIEAIFQVLHSLIFSPPNFFGKQPFSHEIKEIFLLFLELPHKYSLHLLFTSFNMLWGKVNTTPQKLWMEKKATFLVWSLPAKDNCLEYVSLIQLVICQLVVGIPFYSISWMRGKSKISYGECFNRKLCLSNDLDFKFTSYSSHKRFLICLY